MLYLFDLSDTISKLVYLELIGNVFVLCSDLIDVLCAM